MRDLWGFKCVVWINLIRISGSLMPLKTTLNSSPFPGVCWPSLHFFCPNREGIHNGVPASTSCTRSQHTPQQHKEYSSAQLTQSHKWMLIDFWFCSWSLSHFLSFSCGHSSNSIQLGPWECPKPATNARSDLSVEVTALPGVIKTSWRKSGCGSWHPDHPRPLILW